MPAALSVTEVRKTYGDLAAVDGITLEVAVGEMFGILGPNGAGKTTLLEIVTGLRPADSGDVRLLGESPWPRRLDLARRIGVQLQSSAFFERLTAREQVRTFAELYGAPRSRADELLAEVGLDDRAEARTEDLSGGQQQRLAIAATLVNDPEVIFLDEPTASLDPQARRNLWDLLSSLNASGRTVVLTTHHIEEAEYLCDRVAIIDAGKVIALDRPAELVRSLDAPVRIAVARAAIDAGTLAGVAGDAEVTDDGTTVTITTRFPEQVLLHLAERDALAGLRVSAASLEDVFLELTGREYRA